MPAIFPKPDKSTPLTEADGKSALQAWFDFWGYLDSQIKSLAAQIAALVILTPATQADQETATSNTVAVTPGRQQFHPSAAKAWVKFATTGANGAQTVNASYNVSGVSRTSLGHFVVTFSTAFSSANYAAAVTSLGANLIGNAESQAAGTCGLTFFTGAPAVADPTVGYAVFFGDQ